MNLLGVLIPESPARTAGEQLRLAVTWRRLVRDLPTTPTPTTPPRPGPHRKDT